MQIFARDTCKRRGVHPGAGLPGPFLHFRSHPNNDSGSTHLHRSVSKVHIEARRAVWKVLPDDWTLALSKLLLTIVALACILSLFLVTIATGSQEEMVAEGDTIDHGHFAWPAPRKRGKHVTPEIFTKSGSVNCCSQAQSALQIKHPAPICGKPGSGREAAWKLYPPLPVGHRAPPGAQPVSLALLLLLL